MQRVFSWDLSIFRTEINVVWLMARCSNNFRILPSKLADFLHGWFEVHQIWGRNCWLELTIAVQMADKSWHPVTTADIQNTICMEPSSIILRSLNFLILTNRYINDTFLTPWILYFHQKLFLWAKLSKAEIVKCM